MNNSRLWSFFQTNGKPQDSIRIGCQEGGGSTDGKEPVCPCSIKAWAIKQLIWNCPLYFGWNMCSYRTLPRHFRTDGYEVEARRGVVGRGGPLKLNLTEADMCSEKILRWFLCWCFLGHNCFVISFLPSLNPTPFLFAVCWIPQILCECVAICWHDKKETRVEAKSSRTCWRCFSK